MYTVYTKNTQGNTRFSDELISERALLDNGEKKSANAEAKRLYTERSRLDLPKRQHCRCVCPLRHILVKIGSEIRSRVCLTRNLTVSDIYGMRCTAVWVHE